MCLCGSVFLYLFITFEFVELRLEFFSSKKKVNGDSVSVYFVIASGMVLQQVLVKVPKGRKLVFWEKYLPNLAGEPDLV